MSILDFQRPDKVYMIESTDFHGNFEFSPLEPGYGLTIGNALRRVLLSSLEGFAITSIKIEGVEHEFSSIKGVVEDDTEINPELVICNMDKSVEIEMELTIEKGRGYIPAEENKKVTASLGTIFIDSIFTPIKNVKFGVENFRVEQKTDYEKLVFEIITDGSIHPKDALTEAAKILIQHFMLFADENVSFEQTEADSSHEFDEDTLHMRQLLKTKLIDLELSVRALNCLKTAEVETLGELVSFNKSDLLKFRNFGKKSLTELEEMVLVKGLNFGMDIAKFNLDKE